jgi:DNA-directed RNA polymerase specialized sigma24 family protein
MWSAVKGEKFGKFPDLKALLEYLKLCVASCVIDHARKEKSYLSAQSLPTSEQTPADDDKTSAPSIEQALLADLAQAELWQRICQRLNDEREYDLLYYRFVLGLMPKEICQRFPQEFPAVNEIYTLLQNVLARLRRDPGLRKFLGDDV